jgi:hypothetical protein
MFSPYTSLSLSNFSLSSFTSAGMILLSHILSNVDVTVCGSQPHA